MKKGILILVMLLCVHMVAADVLITEVMHSPNNTESDTDGEWIELYNSGLEAVDLAEYKIDGYNFEDFVLASGEYLVVARELIDGDDVDLESFESVYGNNNGMWDESFNAVDGYFSLSTEDTVVLSDGEAVVDQVTYSNSTMCLELVNSEWQESVGTPGEGYMQQEEDGIQVSVLVENNVPVIESVNLLTDDAEDVGIQILPGLNGTEVLLSVNVSDLDSDIQNVTVLVSNRSYGLNLSEGVYRGSFLMTSELAGYYDANVSVCEEIGRYGRTAEDVVVSECACGCTDYTISFVAIARAKGISTTLLETISEKWVAEMVFDHEWNGKVYGHFYSEVYLEDEQVWAIVDPTLGWFTVWDDQYVLGPIPWDGDHDYFIGEDGIVNGAKYLIFERGLDSWDYGVYSEDDFREIIEERYYL